MMVYFRERIGMNLVKQINSYMVKDFTQKNEESESEKKNEESELEETQNKGKLILDATAATARHNLPQ